MIVDTSAVVAILTGEPERAAFLEAIRAADAASFSAASYLEAALLVDGCRDAVLSRELDALLGALHVMVADVTAEQARIARQAYRDFGRRSGHPARLNFGDCFSYALAVDRDEPLLFKGDDFGHTGVPPALG